MDYKSKNKVLYRGFTFECFLLVVVPVVLYIAFLIIFGAYFPERKVMNEISARVIGFGLGSVYHMACIVAGVFRESWAAVKTRVGNFFENAEISLKIAFHGYLDDLKTESLEFWAYMAIVVCCGMVAAGAIKEFLILNGLL